MYQGNKHYQSFFKVFCSCHPQNSQATNQSKANKLWATIKKKGECEINMEQFNSIMSDMQDKAKERMERKDIRIVFTKGTKKVNPTGNNPAKERPGPVLDETIVVDAGPTEYETVYDDNYEEVDEIVIKRTKPVQEKLEAELVKLELTILKLKEAKALSNTEESVCSLTTRIKTLEDTRAGMEKTLKLKKQHVEAQQRARSRKKSNIEKLQQEYPEIAAKLKSKETPGCPRIESDQPDLLKDILEIATIGAACSDKRREELFRTVKTLDDLKSTITDLGYNISRTALYYRLLPKNSSSIASGRHVKTVPVRLVR